MAGRTQYSPAKLSALAAALKLNGGNVERTAKDTGIPASTVREYKKRWQDGIPDEIAQAADDVADDIIEEMSRVRMKALRELEDKLPKARPGELNAIIGTLDDKITRARGLPTQRTETVGLQISPTEIRELMTTWARATLNAAHEREVDIIEVEAIVEQPVGILPPAKE